MARVILINADPAFEIARFARQICPDLYHAAAQVEIWDVTEQTFDGAEIWGAWPRDFRSGHGDVVDELMDEIEDSRNASRSDMLAIGVIYGAPSDVSANRFFSGDDLRRLGDLIKQGNFEDSIWRAGLFTASGRKSMQPEEKVARDAWGLTSDLALDTAILLGGLHADLRGLEILASMRVAIDILSSSPSQAPDGELLDEGVGWRRVRSGYKVFRIAASVDRPDEPRLLRALFGRLREAERDHDSAPDDAGVEEGSNIDKIGADVDGLLALIDDHRAPGSTLAANPNWGPSIMQTRVFASGALVEDVRSDAQKYFKELGRFDADMVQSLQEKKKEKSKDFDKTEKNIIEAVKRLEGASVGVTGDHMERIRDLAARVEKKREELVAACAEARHEIDRRIVEHRLERGAVESDGEFTNYSAPPGPFNDAMEQAESAAQSLSKKSLFFPLVAVIVIFGFLAVLLLSFYGSASKAPEFWSAFWYNVSSDDKNAYGRWFLFLIPAVIFGLWSNVVLRRAGAAFAEAQEALRKAGRERGEALADIARRSAQHGHDALAIGRLDLIHRRLQQYANRRQQDQFRKEYERFIEIRRDDLQAFDKAQLDRKYENFRRRHLENFRSRMPSRWIGTTLALHLAQDVTERPEIRLDFDHGERPRRVRTRFYLDETPIAAERIDPPRSSERAF